MNVKASPKSDFRTIGLALAFLALCLKLAVPVGFMPVAATGGPAFGICSSAALQAVGERGVPDDSHAKAGGDCVFSLLHESALAAADLAVPRKPIGKMAPPESSLSAATPQPDRLFAPPPPSHAPPNL
jgi:hypothetical protein